MNSNSFCQSTQNIRTLSTWLAGTTSVPPKLCVVVYSLTRRAVGALNIEWTKCMQMPRYVFVRQIDV